MNIPLNAEEAQLVMDALSQYAEEYATTQEADTLYSINKRIMQPSPTCGCTALGTCTTHQPIYPLNNVQDKRSAWD